MVQQTPKFKTPLKSPGSINPYKRILIVIGAIILVGITALVTAILLRMMQPPVQQAVAPQSLSTTVNKPKENHLNTLELEPTKQYGNKYADGLLPVGDNKYVTDVAKKGHLYLCSQYAKNLSNEQSGAGTRGPWFTNNNTQYDINKKAAIKGNVSWKGEFSNTLTDGTRTITTNGLPLSHTTGTFPVASSDPAYAYDRNPNKISAQSLTYSLPASPTYSSPQCMGGEVGVMLTGVPIFNGFDAGGRDAGAWEVQDTCEGHPQVSGQYHYHTLSSCITDISVKTIIGFALDGFPITGPQISPGNILTTDDLDVCHGITSEIILNSKPVRSYHYVMTQDFPYSLSCFRSKASQPPRPQSSAQPATPTNQQQSSMQQNTNPLQNQQPPQGPTGIQLMPGQP